MAKKLPMAATYNIIEEDITHYALELAEDNLSFAETMRQIKTKFGDTYDRKRIATLVKSVMGN